MTEMVEGHVTRELLSSLQKADVRVAQLEARVTQLLEANNAEVERRREAERKAALPMLSYIMEVFGKLDVTTVSEDGKGVAWLQIMGSPADIGKFRVLMDACDRHRARVAA